MTAEELEKKVWETAIEFGIFTQTMKDADGKRGTPNAMKRSNIKGNSFAEGKAYFGYVRPEEAPSGPYYDLSFVVFPQENTGKCIVSLGVGSSGFQRDYDLAAIAGTRRIFSRLTKNDGYSFVKTNFTDIDTVSNDLLDKIQKEEELNPLLNVIDTYSKVLLASRIVDPETEFEIIAAWLAQYAKIRNWGTQKQRKAQDKAINKVAHQETIDVLSDIKRLIYNRRFVVLQGAPGTGKTFNALKLSEDYQKTHFIQFHAETTYSDFVEGIRPKLNCNQLIYEHVTGELVEAIKSANKLLNTEKRVLLIIDEINRANLANVLGPIFYLFENQAGPRQVKLNIGGLELSQLPKNLDVIATMNTADRSLAVVDFALRRRFAWYTIRPQKIEANSTQFFHNNLFARFSEIFDRYATDEELNLQPGPSYFLTPLENAQDIMKDRLIYELIPLIKEYLAEGLLRKATDSFAQLFYEETEKHLFE